VTRRSVEILVVVLAVRERAAAAVDLNHADLGARGRRRDARDAVAAGRVFTIGEAIAVVVLAVETVLLWGPRARPCDAT
jgi:hypothetical protein